ncbi:hypothetical protein [Dyella jiangningensis]|uniref:Uncharacterized protein n=1 Tax=Dyella jiangningensis TaxID=1379159 RepID=A0A328P3I4_9GAMM|nr:hypothetical protein [Dyella jiangningensis]RAO76559.1 hypothetical protein CA260_01115 [Dyella jiangningensis]
MAMRDRHDAIAHWVCSDTNNSDDAFLWERTLCATSDPQAAGAMAKTEVHRVAAVAHRVRSHKVTGTL